MRPNPILKTANGSAAFVDLKYSLTVRKSEFNYLLIYFEEELAFEQNIKSLYLIVSVLLGLLFYLFISFWIKAFKISDIKLKY